MKNMLIYLAASLFLFSCSRDKVAKDDIPSYPTPSIMKSISAIHNPERGLFLESNYFAHNLKNPWLDTGAKDFPNGYIEYMTSSFICANDSLSEIQLYIYLTEYVGKDIEQEAFDNMQTLFDQTREKGYKIILRFAYDYSTGATDVTFDDIFRHLNQLKPIIQKNIGLIDIWQIGFVGAWGEGHSSPLSNDWDNRGELARRLLDIFTDRQITVRYPVNKNKLGLTEEQNMRCGFHNDYFTASEHPLAPDNDYVSGTAVYSLVENESPYVKIAGEIPYAENSKWGLHSTFSVPNALRALRDHHYDAFDVTQNNGVNIAHWKEYKLSAQMLSMQHILFEDEYFLDENGEYVYRSAYEFIRDHLGYRLYFDWEKTKLSVSGTSLDYDISIRNVGFSAIKNPRPVYLVVINESGQVVQKELVNEKPSNWQPFDSGLKTYDVLTHKITGSFLLNISQGTYKVGLWLPDPTELLNDNSRYAIRFANRDLELWEGNGYRLNIIDTIQL